LAVTLWCQYLAVLALPLSLFACMRLLGFAPLAAAAASLLMPFVAGPGDGGFGLDLRSWMTYGLFPQAVATSLLLLAIGLGYQAVRRGARLAMTGAVLGLTCL